MPSWTWTFNGQRLPQFTRQALYLMISCGRVPVVGCAWALIENGKGIAHAAAITLAVVAVVLMNLRRVTGWFWNGVMGFMMFSCLMCFSLVFGRMFISFCVF